MTSLVTAGPARAAVQKKARRNGGPTAFPLSKDYHAPRGGRCKSTVLSCLAGGSSSKAAGHAPVPNKRSAGRLSIVDSTRNFSYALCLGWDSRTGHTEAPPSSPSREAICPVGQVSIPTYATAVIFVVIAVIGETDGKTRLSVPSRSSYTLWGSRVEKRSRRDCVRDLRGRHANYEMNATI